MTTIISGSSPSITFSDSTTQTTAFTTPVSIANGGTGSTTLAGANIATTNSSTQSITSINTFGFKNRIINGGMVISQRGTSPTITGGGEYSVDRYLNYYSGNAYTSVQSTTAPAGFINSLLLTVTTASASPTYSFFGQKIEGLNCADLNFGTSSALTVTLSFWVRSSIIGIYSISLSNNNGDRSYAAQYTINTANTWEQKTITIAGDTSGTWLTTNGTGIFVRWDMGTSSSGRLISAGSWQAANADGATGSTGANTWANSSGATFYITGVQLEVGTQATSFDFRDYGRELILCQRYFEKFSVPTSQSGYVGAGVGVAFTTTAARIMLQFQIQKRSAPSISATGTINWGVGGTNYSQTGFAFDGATINNTLMYGNISGTAIQGNALQAWVVSGDGFSVSYNSEL